jgi:ABC-2 type transport system ATP-binding protein
MQTLPSNAIEIKDLTKVYQGKNGTKIALNKVNLKIPAGSFFGLLGPNGAGKSTLINILASITNKTSGEVKVWGYDIVKNNNEAKQSIGIVPQELVLDTFFTVREALDYHAGYYGVAKSQRKTDEIIEAMGLSDKANAHPRSLSGGMKRRLLIAKALVHSPPVLILDEPTAGVDIELREQLWRYITALNKKGTTVILTTHYLEEAEKLCSDIAIINHGNIVVSDKSENLLQSLDYKQLKVTFARPFKAIPESLQNLQTALLPSGEVVIKYQPQIISLNELMKQLLKLEEPVVNITNIEPDLEDIFKRVVYSS